MKSFDITLKYDAPLEQLTIIDNNNIYNSYTYLLVKYKYNINEVLEDFIDNNVLELEDFKQDKGECKND